MKDEKKLHDIASGLNFHWKNCFVNYQYSVIVVLPMYVFLCCVFLYQSLLLSTTILNDIK